MEPRCRSPARVEGEARCNEVGQGGRGGAAKGKSGCGAQIGLLCHPAEARVTVKSGNSGKPMRGRVFTFDIFPDMKNPHALV